LTIVTNIAKLVLDFLTKRKVQKMEISTEKYDAILESYNNGQPAQVIRLFKKLRGVQNKLDFIAYVRNNYGLKEYEVIDILSFLLRKMVDNRKV